MPAESTRAFRQHSRNLKSVEHGLLMAERAHKAAIRRNHQDEIEFHSRMHLLVVGVMAEARLRKILWDPSGFNNRERDLVLSKRSQLERWELAVEYAFRRHYTIPMHLGLDAVPQPQRDQSARLRSMLGTDLKPVIETRNDVAHGFWEWIMNARETSITAAAPSLLNYLQIHRRSGALAELGGLIYALTISEPTFQRDYDEHLNAIEALSRGFAADDFTSWKQTMAPMPQPAPIRVI